MKFFPINAEYFDLAGASAYTGGGLSIRTLRRLIARPGGLPHYRIGRGKVMIRRADLDTFLEAHRQIPMDLDALANDALAEFGLGGRR
jgi:excisionase family DNA binding protein